MKRRRDGKKNNSHIEQYRRAESASNCRDCEKSAIIHSRAELNFSVRDGEKNFSSSALIHSIVAAK